MPIYRTEYTIEGAIEIAGLATLLEHDAVELEAVPPRIRAHNIAGTDLSLAVDLLVTADDDYDAAVRIAGLEANVHSEHEDMSEFQLPRPERTRLRAKKAAPADVAGDADAGTAVAVTADDGASDRRCPNNVKSLAAGGIFGASSCPLCDHAAQLHESE